MSEKSISEAIASVMLYSYERKEWEDFGEAWVQVYHHLVNNTYRIVGRNVKDESVLINFALVKGFVYVKSSPIFLQWSYQSQSYRLNFASEQDAQVFEHGVFTALEDLKTSETAPPQKQPRNKKLLQQIEPLSNASNEKEPDKISSHHGDQPQFDAKDKHSSRETPEQTYYNQSEIQRQRQKQNQSKVPLSSSGPKPVTQSTRVPPQPKPRTKHQLPEQIELSPYARKGRIDSDKITPINPDQLQFDANDKYSPGEARERIYYNHNERQRARQRPGVPRYLAHLMENSTGSKERLQQTQAQADEVLDIMKVNVYKVLERDAMLSELDARAEQSAARLKRKTRWQNLKDNVLCLRRASIEESAVPSSILPGPHPVKQSKTRPSEMTKHEAHSSSAAKGGITNKAYLPHQGEKKEENEEGKGKGQEEISKGGTGLAFSGGGIRSAAFCSGVLRSLLNSGVEVDYLSCVSGGGYTGTAYLDWKYHEKKKDVTREGEGKGNEKKKDDTREGEGKGGWHEAFFNHMKDRSGYICDWTGFCGLCDALVFFTLMALVLVVLPVIKWGTYAFPVALMIDLFGIGNLMRKSADCDAALERQREINPSAVPDNDLIDRCLSGNHKRDIAILFSTLFGGFVVLYVGISKLKKKCSKNPCLKSVLLLFELFEYAAACLLMFTFIPFTIYDFFLKIPVWAQVLLLILMVIVWVAIPFLRRKTSFVLIVYFYSFVIYWRVFRVDIPVLPFLNHEDHVSHWLLFASGIALMTSSFTTNWKDELLHRYFRWRVQKAFYHKNNNTEPLTLADLQDTKPEYISNIVVNRWKNNDEDKNNYALLTMSPSGIERFGRREKNQFKGKVEPKDIMLSEAMSISAATLSKHMGKYNDSIEGLTRLHTILGLDMGARMISDAGHRKKWPRQLLTWLFDFVLGSLLIIPTICYNHGRKHFEPSLLGCMITFLVVHVMLVIIAVLDVRWFTVHNSFVYNVRLLFSLDTIGSIPPAVLQLSDGGHYENLALLPLLQRKLKRIVVVDGGYKDEEEDYGKSILDALMLACTELKCSFYDKDGKDVISDLMQTFVNPSKEQKSCYYKLKVHYGAKNDSDPECDGEIIILVPRKSEDIQSDELTWCCCECCHSKSCLCSFLSTCLCNEFPQHNTVNQFFTPRMFEAYHQEGRRACEEAKANEFLKTVCPANDVRDSLEEPKRPAFQSPGGAGSFKGNEIPLSDIKIE